MNKIFEKAKEIASNLEERPYRLCAIITDKRGRILSIGTNSYSKSHPTQAYYAEKVGRNKAIFLHSELDAIIKLPYNAKAYSIYIARVNKKGKPRLAKPCSICKQAIRDIGIKSIYYTINKDNI